MNPTIMTSCDSVYLRDHAPALMLSAVLNDNNFHLHVIENQDEKQSGADEDYMHWLKHRCMELASKYERSPIITLSIGHIKQKIRGGEQRVYYACDRFISAYERLQWTSTDDDDADCHVNSLVIVDTDCLVLSKFPEPTQSLGLFFRESLPGTTGWEAAGTKIAAGLVYVKNNMIGHEFLSRVEELLGSLPVEWFADQVALSTAASEYHQSDVHRFGPDILDWEFVQNTVIWTGKGERKYKNQTYLEKKAMFTKMI